MARRYLVLGFWQSGKPYSVGAIELQPGQPPGVTGGEYLDQEDSPRDYEGPWALEISAEDAYGAEAVARKEMADGLI